MSNDKQVIAICSFDSTYMNDLMVPQIEFRVKPFGNEAKFIVCLFDSASINVYDLTQTMKPQRNEMSFSVHLISY